MTPIQRQQHSVAWYRRIINGFASNSRLIERENIGRLDGLPKLGRLTFFFYDPKLKATLPYYDRFPLVLPLNYYNDGILGLNLHYLPEGARMSFFEQLLGSKSNEVVSLRKYMGYNASTRLDVDYPMLRDVNKYSAYKECIKRYLYSQVRSQFLDINPPHWHMAVSLPVARFTKGSPY